jgi:hypothetical protein
MKAHECSIARTMRIDFDESRLDREKEKAPKTIQVASLGRLCAVKGGVSRVIELIGAHLPDPICVRFIATYNRYTGYEGVTRADRSKQACPGVCLSSGLCPDTDPALA